MSRSASNEWRVHFGESIKIVHHERGYRDVVVVRSIVDLPTAKRIAAAVNNAESMAAALREIIESCPDCADNDCDDAGHASAREAIAAFEKDSKA